eukprot:gene23274-30504_t
MELPPDSQARGNYDDMLRDPGTCKDEATLQRATTTYSCQNDRFRIKKRNYERQYAQLYFSRLMTMSQFMRDKVTKRWPCLDLVKILDVGAIEDKEVIAFGTLYKEMKLKPSIMDEYTKDRGVAQMLSGTNFCSDTDHLVLEDEGGRMIIRGDCLSIPDLVTGVVVAVRGMAEPGGDFIVREVCFPEMAPQAPPPDAAAVGVDAPGKTTDKYIALISGLAVGSNKSDGLQVKRAFDFLAGNLGSKAEQQLASFETVQLAFDFLAGNLGSKAEQQLASQVARVVIAGGLLSGAMDQLAVPTAPGRSNSRHTAQILEPVKDLDMYLTELATALPVDVMPGAEDPCNFALPQQPLHRCLLPSACTLGSFRRSTNPAEFQVDGVSFLGTSGQNIDDMAKYSQCADRIDLMENSLNWRHLAPTAPDTLSCYPYNDVDPFVVASTPHVYFVGNQPEFKTSIVAGADGQRVRLVMLPAFWRSGTMVLVNTRTLGCHPIRFNGTMAMDKQEE